MSNLICLLQKKYINPEIQKPHHGNKRERSIQFYLANNYLNNQKWNIVTSVLWYFRIDIKGQNLSPDLTDPEI